MGLIRNIPHSDDEALPFLHEVNFKQLGMRLAALEVTQPAEKANAPSADVANDNVKTSLHHFVGIQPKLDRLRSILASSRVDNAWITGIKGIGKTALVEALIRDRAQNRLTGSLMSKPFFLFDVNAFFTQPRENWARQFDECLKKISDRNGLIIIDHMDDFMNTADGEAGRLMSTLIMHLERNDGLQAVVISESEGEKVIREASTGVDRRFQQLRLSEEPKDGELRLTVISHLGRFEKTHNVHFSLDAVDEIVRLLNRYPGRAFTGARPDNAIKFADEAATYVRLNKYAEPPELTEMRERLSQVRDELVIVSADGKKGESRQKELEAEITRLTTSYEQADKAWKKKFDPLFKARAQFEELDAKLEELRKKSERTSSENQKFDIYTHGYEAAKAKVDAEEKALYPEPPTVGPKHVRAVFSRASGISASALNEDKLTHLAKVDEYLDSEIFRQDEPKRAVSNAYFQRETGISDPSRPAGVFLFLGGTGLGKTELVKVLARFDGGDGNEPVIVRLSEFKGKEAGKRLTGADPGLVGYEDGSCLDAVGKNPRALVLFDEAEKADPSVFDVLMQVLEEGKITPSNSKKPIELKDTIVFLASNALKASDFSREELHDEVAVRERLKTIKNADTDLPQFKPEFLGRIDRVFVFEDLQTPEHVKILAKEVRKINRDYSGRGLSVELDPAEAASIVNFYNDPTVGGRLARNITNKHIRPLLTSYLREHIDEVMSEDSKFQAHLRIAFEGNHITLKPVESPAPAAPVIQNVPLKTAHM